MSDAAVTANHPRAGTATQRLTGWLRNPWGEPRVLRLVTWVYLAWSILPVLIAIVFSFNSGRSRSTWQGFSLRWWYQDPFDSLWRDEALRSAMFQTFRLSLVCREGGEAHSGDHSRQATGERIGDPLG